MENKNTTPEPNSSDWIRDAFKKANFPFEERGIKVPDIDQFPRKLLLVVTSMMPSVGIEKVAKMMEAIAANREIVVLLPLLYAAGYVDAQRETSPKNG